MIDSLALVNSLSPQILKSLAWDAKIFQCRLAKNGYEISKVGAEISIAL